MSLLGAPSVGWLGLEVEMARIVDASRGAPQWVSARALCGPGLPSTQNALEVVHPGGAPVHTSGPTWPVGQSIRRVVDDVDSMTRQRLSSGGWRRVDTQDFPEIK